jgi:hypothetical protein
MHAMPQVVCHLRLDAWRDPLLEVVMWIMQLCRRPWDHQLAHLQKPKTSDVSASTAFSELVCGKASEILSEFSELIHMQTWASLVESVPCAHLDTFLELIVNLAGHHAAQYHLRLVRRCMEFPHQLMWLAESGGADACDNRKRVARYILETPDESLEINCLKCKRLFQAELEETARTGLLNSAVVSLFRLVRSSWGSHIQCLEGMNSVIGLMAKRAPNMAVDLLSSRILVKNHLNIWGKDSSQKYSEVKPSIDALVDLAVTSFEHADDVVNLPNRFAVPSSATPFRKPSGQRL